MYSPERDTLDQLCGGDMTVACVRRIYDTDDRFIRAILVMLDQGDLRLLRGGVEVPKWEHRQTMELPNLWDSVVLSVTDAGASKVS